MMYNEYSLKSMNLNVEKINLGLGLRDPSIVNEGDLNNDGSDEISVFSPPGNGSLYSVKIYSLNNSKWSLIYGSILVPLYQNSPKIKDIIFNK